MIGIEWLGTDEGLGYRIDRRSRRYVVVVVKGVSACSGGK